MATKFFNCAVTIAFLLSSMAANASDLTKEMQQKFPGTPITSAKSVPQIPGLVEIVTGKQIIYSSKDGKTLVFGHLFDSKTNTDITQSKLDQLTQVDWKGLDKTNSLTIKKGNGENHFAVFSDINCGYCKKLDSEMAQMNNYTAHIYLISYEYASQGKQQVPAMKLNMLEKIMCAEDPGYAYNQYMSHNRIVDSAKPMKKCDFEAKLKANTLTFLANGQRGTPNLVAPNNKVQAGYMPAQQLFNWVTQNQK